jgi:hypothetical protein
METKEKNSFDEAELELLKGRIKRTHKERLLFAIALYKAQITMNKAKITHKPFIAK